MNNFKITIISVDDITTLERSKIENSDIILYIPERKTKDNIKVLSSRWDNNTTLEVAKISIHKMLEEYRLLNRNKPLLAPYRSPFDKNGNMTSQGKQIFIDLFKHYYELAERKIRVTSLKDINIYDTLFWYYNDQIVKGTVELVDTQGTLVNLNTQKYYINYTKDLILYKSH